jgi:hypothetical protein
MKLDEHIGAPSTLGEWLGRLGSFPGDGWLLVERGLQVVSAETKCRPVVTGGRELSDDDEDALDALIAHAHLQWFLSQEELQGIMDNLRAQDPTASPESAIAAVQFYWDNDAFIELRDT